MKRQQKRLHFGVFFHGLTKLIVPLNVEAIIDKAKACKSVSVPDNFEVWATVCIKDNGKVDDSVQPCVFWFMGTPEVNVTCTKNVSNPAAVSGNGLYSVQGTTFNLYDSQAKAQSGTSPVATFTINASGQSGTVKLKPGTYYLVETKAGPGLVIPDALKAASGGRAVAVADKTTTINV